MEFKKYQHIEKLQTDETDGIEIGEVYIFPKLDGTNASVWKNESGEICAGSRNRELTIESDNAGFCAWVKENVDMFNAFFQTYPNAKLYGEWLITHTFKHYRKDALRKFYVFDMLYNEEIMGYDAYSGILEKHGISFIPPIWIMHNPSVKQMYAALEKNNYLVEDGKGTGEGVVVKNYCYVNKYGRQTWAKIVTSEFKEKHIKTMGAPKVMGETVIEDKIVENYCTTAFIEKEVAKIKLSLKEAGETYCSKTIPRILNTVYHELITEESWNFIKKYKFPTIDFSLLNRKVTQKIKETIPELF